MRLCKQQLETKVFEHFVKHTGINVVRFESCDPPKPDIVCETECGEVYFELTDNTCTQIQRSAHAKEATAREAGWLDPFPESYKKKFEKTYETDSADIDLLIYFGIHPVAELGGHFCARLHENVKWIRRRQSEGRRFRTVWIYDYHRDRVLARITRKHVPRNAGGSAATGSQNT